MESSNAPSVDLTGALHCTLLDRRSSVPLHGARINCISRDNRVLRFDADRNGRFTTKLPQGAYDLVISARGYLSLLVRGVGVLAGHRQIVTRALVPGESDTRHPEGDPATAVGGFVTDRFHHAVADLNVKLCAGSGDAAYTTRTERDGAYLFHGVLPQEYILTVASGNRRLLRLDLTVIDSREFVRHDMKLLQA